MPVNETPPTAETPEHVDVIVVGAGISGIGAGHHLQKDCPDRSYVILEGREHLGGTWDLFRYPGVRSDSDMHTLGYSFKPWTAEKSIADGRSILLGATAQAVDPAIERARLTEELTTATREAERARRKLEDARFVERAPAQLVEAGREKALRCEPEREALAARIAALG